MLHQTWIGFYHAPPEEPCLTHLISALLLQTPEAAPSRRGRGRAAATATATTPGPKRTFVREASPEFVPGPEPEPTETERPISPNESMVRPLFMFVLLNVESMGVGEKYEQGRPKWISK